MDSQASSTRFTVKRQVSFKIEPGSITWRVKGLNGKERKGPEEATYVESPPYLQSVIASLVEQGAIERKFKVCLQYLVVGAKFLISYDVIETKGEPTGRTLSTATFDIEDREAQEQQAFFTELYTALLTSSSAEEQKSCSQEIDAELSRAVPRETSNNLMQQSPVWKAAGFIDHDIEVTGYESSEPGTKKLTAKMETVYRRHPYGEYASVFALPPFPADNVFPTAPIAVAGIDENGACSLSDTVVENLRALELAMSLPDPKIVFIQGEPGSGKESFACAIHYGSKRTRRSPKPDSKEDVVTRSVAGMSLEQFKRELFGEDLPGGHHIPGRIEKAKNGTLFLDEFDKFDKSAANTPYSELLRVWEAKEFVPWNGRSAKEAEDVNWVVAGAFTSERTMSELPQDIWSRFNAQLTIKSPLSAPAVVGKDRSDYIRALVLTFMLTIGLKKVDPKKVRVHDLANPTTRVAQVVGSILFENKKEDWFTHRLEPSKLMLKVASVLALYIGEYTLCVFRCPKDWSGTKPKVPDVEICMPNALALLANFDFETRHLTFAERPSWRASQKFSKRDSIRAIRQACTVVFGRLFEFRLQGREKKKPNGDSNEEVVERVKQILCEAFAAVDLARTGSSPGQFANGKALSEAIIADGGGVVPTELVKELAELVAPKQT